MKVCDEIKAIGDDFNTLRVAVDHQRDAAKHRFQARWDMADRCFKAIGRIEVLAGLGVALGTPHVPPLLFVFGAILISALAVMLIGLFFSPIEGVFGTLGQRSFYSTRPLQRRLLVGILFLCLLMGAFVAFLLWLALLAFFVNARR